MVSQILHQPPLRQDCTEKPARLLFYISSLNIALEILGHKRKYAFNAEVGIIKNIQKIEDNSRNQHKSVQSYQYISEHCMINKYVKWTTEQYVCCHLVKGE